jgi:hypothetical protein
MEVDDIRGKRELREVNAILLIREESEDFERRQEHGSCTHSVYSEINLPETDRAEKMEHAIESVKSCQSLPEKFSLG